MELATFRLASRLSHARATKRSEAKRTIRWGGLGGCWVWNSWVSLSLSLSFFSLKYGSCGGNRFLLG